MTDPTLPRGDTEIRPWRRTAAAMAVKGLNTALNFAVTIVLARLLGPASYGIYAFALASMSLLASPMHMGLPTLLVREVAAIEVRKAWGELRGMIRASFGLAGLVSLVVTMSAGLGLWFFRHHLPPAELRAFGAMLVLLNIRTISVVASGVIMGCRRVLAAQIPQHILSPSLLLVLVVTAHFFTTLDAATAIGLYALASFVTLIVLLAILRRHLPREILSEPRRYRLRAWLVSLLPMTMLAGLEIFTNQLDIVMLGLLSENTQVGYYRVAFSGAALILLSRMVSDMVIAPQLARFWQQGDLTALQSLIRWSSRIGLIAAAPVTAALLIFGSELIELAYGTPYLPAYAVMMVLCLGQVVNAATGPVQSALQMTGHERETVKAAVGAGVTNIVLNAILIPPYGALGAAIATATSLTGVNIYMSRRLWIRAKLWSPAI